MGKQKATHETPVELMLKSLREGNPKAMTLDDAILTHLKPTRRWEYNSYNASARILLRNEYNDLVGTVIFPVKKQRGVSPLWAVGVTMMTSLVPMPDWSQSNEIIALHSAYRQMGLVPTAAETEKLNTIAKSGKRVYEAATSLLASSVNAANQERVLREDAEQRFKLMEQGLEERLMTRLQARLSSPEAVTA